MNAQHPPSFLAGLAQGQKSLAMTKLVNHASTALQWPSPSTTALRKLCRPERRVPPTTASTGTRGIGPAPWNRPPPRWGSTDGNEAVHGPGPGFGAKQGHGTTSMALFEYGQTGKTKNKKTNKSGACYFLRLFFDVFWVPSNHEPIFGSVASKHLTGSNDGMARIKRLWRGCLLTHSHSVHISIYYGNMWIKVHCIIYMNSMARVYSYRFLIATHIGWHVAENPTALIDVDCQWILLNTVNDFLHSCCDEEAS